MNPEILLRLIHDLYGQIAQRNEQLDQANQKIEELSDQLKESESSD